MTGENGKSVTEQAPKEPLECVELDHVWKFATDPDDVGVEQKWYAPDTDDGEWAEVRDDLEKGWDRQGFPNYAGYGWYRRQIPVPEGFADWKYQYLLFAGADQDAEVYVNGAKVFEHSCASTGLPREEIWITPFAVDAKSLLKPGGEMLLAVRIYNPEDMGGIWRPVYLVGCNTEISAREMDDMIDAPKVQERAKKAAGANIYGTDEAVSQMLRTFDMGGVAEPSGDELAAMQQEAYILHAAGGKLTRVAAEKVCLPLDPRGHPQRISLMKGTDGAVYATQATLISKSTDAGRTWSTHETPLGASPNRIAQVLSNGTFILVRAEEPDDPARLVVMRSDDEGRTWEAFSEVDNPAGCPVRHPGHFCRLADDTLVLPVESRFEWKSDPEYVHVSTDGGKTWHGPTGVNTGPGYLGGYCYETMIAEMASGRLLACIRYHGPVVDHWPLIDADQHTFYKTVFVADSDDRGTTWRNLRPVTTVHGQCHGFALGLSDGSVVMSHDHRYPPGTTCGRAMISRDEGRTWADEVYYLYYGANMNGFSQSLELDDGMILTVGITVDGRHTHDYEANADRAIATAIRWQPESR